MLFHMFLYFIYIYSYTYILLPQVLFYVQVNMMPATTLHMFILLTTLWHVNMKPFNEERRDTPFITRLYLGVIFIPHSVLDNSNTYWNNSKIKILDKPFNTTLPDLIPIPITLAKIAKSAIKNPNLYTALWTGMHGRYHAYPLSRVTGERIDDPLLVRSSYQ